MEKTILEEKREADEEVITVEDANDWEGDNLLNLLDCWCGLKDIKFVYLKKAGNHLEVGKAEIHCIE